MKVAKLVIWSPCVRVVVADDASYEDIIAAAKHELHIALQDDYELWIQEVMDDEERPYEEERNPNDWIVGDKYEVTDRLHGHEFEIGDTITLKMIDKLNSGIFESGDEEWWLGPDEVKHIKQ